MSSTAFEMPLAGHSSLWGLSQDARDVTVRLSGTRCAMYVTLNRRLSVVSVLDRRYISSRIRPDQHLSPGLLL